MTTSVGLRRPAPPNGQFRLFRAHVARTRLLNDHSVRVTFGGAELRGVTSGGLDQRIKLLLPRPGQLAPCLPAGRDYRSVRAMPEEIRPIMRSYTARAHRPEQAELDVDFMLHGNPGPGYAFATRAQAGDQVCLYAPAADAEVSGRGMGVEYRPDKVTDRTLIVGDETALPAISGIVEVLPPSVRVKIIIAAPWSPSGPVFTSQARLDVTWLTAQSGAVLPALHSADLAGSGWYAWVAGEAAMVRAARRHLVRERGMPRHAVTFMGYWRRGHTQDAGVSEHC